MTALVEVDRVRANQCAAIIVDDISVLRADDLESCSEWKTRPIGGRAHLVLTGQRFPDRVTPAASFCVCVSGRPHIRNTVSMGGGGLSRGLRGWRLATRDNTGKRRETGEFQIGRHRRGKPLITD